MTDPMNPEAPHAPGTPDLNDVDEPQDPGVPEEVPAKRVINDEGPEGQEPPD